MNNGPIVPAIMLALVGCGGAVASSSDDVVTVERRAFSTSVLAVGAVKAQIGAEVRVGSRISGRVQRLAANIGDAVREGQVLAQLETEELDALVAQRRAELTLAESRLTSIDRMGPDEIGRAEADLRRFEASAQLTRLELQRQQALLKERVSTASEVETARERDLVAQAGREAAMRALDLMRVGNAERRVQAVAELERARASLSSALVELSFTTWRAPISGVVASVATQEGETVAAGLNAPTFVTIVDLDRLQVNAYVDEVDIGRVAPGQAATFTVDAYPSRDFSGSVTAVYPSATIQDNVVKYVVAIELDGNPDRLLRPEMTASVRIQFESRQALAIPVRSIARDSGSTVVFVPGDDGVERRAVRLGWRDGAWAEVVEGLSEGERILRDPPQQGTGGTP
jgi:macrolide-specific efflux system membrane fusion protein